MPKTNRESSKLDFRGRDRIIYEIIKECRDGLTREEIVLLSEYKINQVSSAVANLLDAGHLIPCGERVNPHTGFNNQVVTVNSSHEPPTNRISRRGELAKLRKEVIALTNVNSELQMKYDYLIKSFKQYVQKVHKV